MFEICFIYAFEVTILQQSIRVDDVVLMCQERGENPIFKKLVDREDFPRLRKIGRKIRES